MVVIHRKASYMIPVNSQRKRLPFSAVIGWCAAVYGLSWMTWVLNVDFLRNFGNWLSAKFNPLPLFETIGNPVQPLYHGSERVKGQTETNDKCDAYYWDNKRYEKHKKTSSFKKKWTKNINTLELGKHSISFESIVLVYTVKRSAI